MGHRRNSALEHQAAVRSVAPPGFGPAVWGLQLLQMPESREDSFQKGVFSAVVVPADQVTKLGLTASPNSMPARRRKYRTSIGVSQGVAQSWR
eukprot:8120472-Alexandrium_andersonii.AAC.1